MDYRDRVTAGLLYDVMKLLDRHGIVCPDDQPWRITAVLEALCHMADAVAGARETIVTATPKIRGDC